MLNPELKPCSIEEDNLRSGFGEEQTAVLSPSPDSTCSWVGVWPQKGGKKRKKEKKSGKREKRRKREEKERKIRGKRRKKEKENEKWDLTKNKTEKRSNIYNFKKLLKDAKSNQW